MAKPDKEFDRLSDALHRAAADLVSAVRKMVESKTLPKTMWSEEFPYTYELMEYILARDYGHWAKGYLGILNPKSGEEIIMHRAMAIENVIEALFIGSFKEWHEYRRAIENQEEYIKQMMLKRKGR